MAPRQKLVKCLVQLPFPGTVLFIIIILAACEDQPSYNAPEPTPPDEQEWDTVQSDAAHHEADLLEDALPHEDATDLSPSADTLPEDLIHSTEDQEDLPDNNSSDVTEDITDEAISLLRPLIDHDYWFPTPSEEDPFVTERPSELICPEDAYWTEELGGAYVFELATLSCNYGSFSQPSLISVNEGDVLEFLLFHYELTATMDAEAHAAVVLGEDIIWDIRIEIPADSNMEIGYFTLEKSYAEGTPVHFHLHNHGANEWAFVGINVYSSN